MSVDRFREFLVRHLFSPLLGFSFQDWLGILRRHFFDISPRYWPRALLATAASIQTSQLRKQDLRLVASAPAKVADPIFILGHWRSGTTHLHNLLTLDPRFGFPDYVSVTQPHGFLSSTKRLRDSRLLKVLSPKTRLIDNMAVTLDSPMEDEVALTMLCGLSPVMGFVFPRRAAQYDRYLSLREASPGEKEQWKACLLQFLGKLSIANPRPAVLKSPPHTARIRLILEVFPKARFIHIHRNPYEVYASYRRSALIMLEMMRLQNHAWEGLEDRILSQYRHLYDCYFEDRALIPPGQLSEISYQQLVARPLETLSAVYQQLGLGAVGPLQSAAQAYLTKLGSFRQSDLSGLEPRTIQRVDTEWRRSFEEWGYPMVGQGPRLLKTGT